ncbi:MAG: hypothetical protein N3A54_00025 [Patescibacteria group bacterium]|nr:hypothetical protein [Patescibacteria group bacterium]
MKRYKVEKLNEAFDDLIPLMEYTMDDLFMMFKKWIVEIGNKNEETGRKIFKEIVDYISNTYESETGKSINIHYLIRLLVVLRDKFPDSVTLNDVKAWDKENNVIKTLEIYSDVIKSKKNLKAALTYAPYLKYEKHDLYDEYIDDEINEDLDVDGIIDIIDDFHQIKTHDKFIEFLNAVNIASLALEYWKESSSLSLYEKNPNAKIYNIENYYHSVVLGKGSNWCITKYNYYIDYAKQCDLYVIIPNVPKKYETKKAGEVIEKFALAINKNLSDYSHFLKNFDDKTLGLDELDEDFLNILVKENNNNDEEIYFLLPFFIEYETGKEIVSLIRGFQNDVVDMSSERSFSLLDEFAGYLENLTFKEQSNYSYYSLRKVVHELFDNFMNTYYKVYKNKTASIMLQPASDFEDMLIAIWWMFKNPFDYLSENIDHYTGYNRDDFSYFLKRDLYRIRDSYSYYMKNTNELIYYLEDDYYSIVSSSNNDPIIFELNNEKNVSVSTSEVIKYVQSQELIEKMKEGEETLDKFYDIFDRFPSSASEFDNAVFWVLIEKYSEFLVEKVFNNLMYYNELMKVFSLSGSENSDIISENLALSIFLFAKKKHSSLLKEFCKRNAISSGKFVFENFKDPFLNECQDLLSGRMK